MMAPPRPASCGAEARKQKFSFLDGECTVVRSVLEKWGWSHSDKPGQRRGSYAQTSRIPPDQKGQLLWSFAARRVDGMKDKDRLVNHFPGSWNFGSKYGLGRSLERCQACAAEFFPRQYDLREPQELQAFLEDFTVSEAAGRLQRDPSDAVATRVLARRALRQRLMRCPHECAELHGRVPPVPGRLKPRLRRTLDVYTQCLQSETCSACNDQAPAPAYNMASVSNADTIVGKEILGQQEILNGPENVWILKHPHWARGNGISVHTGLMKVLTEAERRFCKNMRWYCVAQKYIERPLLVQNTVGGTSKCDLRLWILVLSWKPLICFAYKEVYFRVANKTFDLEQANFDVSAHVTNVRQFENRITMEEFFETIGEEKSSLWHTRTWPLMLDAVRASLFACKPGVVACANPPRPGRKPNEGPGAFELFGLDFALDETMRPWLLEANISPDLLGKCPVVPVRMLAEDAVEYLLATVLAHHEGMLPLPKDSDLQAASQEDERTLERLFPEEILNNEGGCHSTQCFGRAVLDTPAPLVTGLDIGDPCGKWLLILKESISNMHLHCSSSAPPEQRITQGLHHDKVLHDVLLPGTGIFFEGQGSKQSAAARARTLSSPPSLANLGGIKAVNERDRRNTATGLSPMRKDVQRESLAAKKPENKKPIQQDSKKEPPKRHTVASIHSVADSPSSTTASSSFQFRDQFDWERSIGSRSPSVSSRSSASESEDSSGPPASPLFNDEDRDELLQELQKQQLSLVEERRRSSMGQVGGAGRPAKRDRLLLGLQEKARQVMQRAGRKSIEKNQDKKGESATEAPSRPQSPQRRSSTSALPSSSKTTLRSGIAAPAAEGVPDMMRLSQNEQECVVTEGENMVTANPQLSTSQVEQDKNRGKNFGSLVGRSSISLKEKSESQADDGPKSLAMWRLSQNEGKSARNSLVQAKEEALQRVSELETQREADKRLQRRLRSEQEQAVRRLTILESKQEADRAEQNLQLKALEIQQKAEVAEHCELHAAWKAEALQGFATVNSQKENQKLEYDSWIVEKDAILEEMEEMRLQREIQNFNEKAEQISFLAGRQKILQDVEQLEMQIEQQKTKHRSLMAAKDRGVEEVRTSHERAERMFQEQMEHLEALNMTRESAREARDECTSLLNEKMRHLAEWEHEHEQMRRMQTEQEMERELLKGANELLRKELDDCKLRNEEQQNKLEAVHHKLDFELCCRKTDQVEYTRMIMENRELAAWKSEHEESMILKREEDKDKIKTDSEDTKPGAAVTKQFTEINLIALEASDRVELKEQLFKQSRRLSVAEKLKQRELLMKELEAYQATHEETHLEANQHAAPASGVDDSETHQQTSKEAELVQERAILLEELAHHKQDATAMREECNCLLAERAEVLQGDVADDNEHESISAAGTISDSELKIDGIDIEMEQLTNDDATRSPKRRTHGRQSVTVLKSKDNAGDFMMNQLRKRQDRRASELDPNLTARAASPIATRSEARCESPAKADVRWDVVNAVGNHMRTQMQKRHEHRKSVDSDSFMIP